MNADTASTRSRIQAEIDHAMQRGIKGVEYLAASGPTVGATPRDVIHQRGTLALYHYRPLVDEIYRVPLLLVMAVTNRGYIRTWRLARAWSSSCSCKVTTSS